MKIALLHDWLVGFRGGERVLEALCELFPDAEIYTLIHKPGSTSPTIEKHKIHTSFLNAIPGIHSQYRKFLPLFPQAAESLRIAPDTQLIISSCHCVIKGVPKPAKAPHISYIHSPMRYLYDQYDVYFGPEAPFIQRTLMPLFRDRLTRWDIDSNKNVDFMIANSEFVRERIQKYYHQDAAVIHPFVDIKDFRARQTQNPVKDDFYLMVTAFAPNKRTDLAIQAFNASGRKLKIIGSGQQESWLCEMAKPNVEFLGNVPREGVVDYFARARALIFPGVEDFGITPLESLAAATPVIAFRSGGVLETLTSSTAVFFNEPTVESLNNAVEEFERRNFKASDLYERAERFSKEKFQNSITSFLQKVLRGESL